MPETSAGILLYRRAGTGPQFLLIHPGGPFWTKKDAGAWSIPKGLCEPEEDFDAAARREFAEETGHSVTAPLAVLGTFTQPSGKRIVAFAAEGDFDPAGLRSNTFELEWPPRSGRRIVVPEADKAGWFDPDAARLKILKGQVPIVDALVARL